MSDFNCYMVAATVTFDKDGEHSEKKVPSFYFRSDTRDGPRTASEAASLALKLLSVTWTPGSDVTAISASAGSLDDHTDTYSMKKTFPSGRLSPAR